MTAVYAWTTRDLVTVTGPDAATYLQGQLSQDVASLAVGEDTQTFVLAPQGKVDGWGRVHRQDDETFVIDVDAGAGADWDARLRRFLLRTAATISVEPDVATVAVRGGVAAGGRVAFGPGVVGVDLIGPDLAGVERGAVPEGLPDGAVEVDAEALDALRIQAGVPKWGSELDADTIPATVGQWAVDASVSFTKGCYTGQELVARIDSRGGNVPRRLVGLTVQGPAPAPGTEVLVDRTPVAHITSSAPAESGSVALAYLPRAVAVDAEGVAAEVAGSSALVRLLPMSADG